MMICDTYSYQAFHDGEYRPLAEWYCLSEKARSWLRMKISQKIKTCLWQESPFNLERYTNDLIDCGKGTGVFLCGGRWHEHIYFYEDQSIVAEIDYWAPKAYLKYSKDLDCSTRDVMVSTDEDELEDWEYLVPFTKAVLKKESEIGIIDEWYFEPATAKQMGYLIGLCKQGKLPYKWEHYSDIPGLGKREASSLIDLAKSDDDQKCFPDYDSEDDTTSAEILFSEDEYYEYLEEAIGKQMGDALHFWSD